MKKLLLLAGRCAVPAALSLLLSSQAAGQCAFTPTITSVEIMCPDETDTLWTQSYDSYQWNKEGAPIPGANQQYLVVDYWVDGGSSFSVTVTQAGCTETSANVLVDGYVFLPPFFSNIGGPNLCPGDTIILQLLPPYVNSIQWFNGGVPVAGANDDTFFVTTPGLYTVAGAPAECPAYVVAAGVDFEATGPTIPQLLPVDLLLCNNHPDTLHTTSSAPHQWFRDGILIPGAVSNELVVSEPGNYYAKMWEGSCEVMTNTVAVMNHVTGSISIIDSAGLLYAVVSDAGIDSFQWYRDDAAIPGANEQTLLPTLPGSYTVSAIDNTCTVLSAPFVHVPSKVPGHLNPGQSVIYPNPAQDYVFIKSAERVAVRIYDLYGRMVSEAAAPGYVRVGALAPGTYLLGLYTPSGELLQWEKLQKY